MFREWGFFVLCKVIFNRMMSSLGIISGKSPCSTYPSSLSEPPHIYSFSFVKPCYKTKRYLLPPNLNSVAMTSLSVDVRLQPSCRHNSIICFRDILPLPALSQTENATFNSEKQQKSNELNLHSVYFDAARQPVPSFVESRNVL